jgi:hypothetical protein
LATNRNLYREPFGDSGGYQYYKFQNEPNKYQCKIEVGQGHKMRGRQIKLDSQDLCLKYGQIGIKFGFTLDFPLIARDGQNEFKEKLNMSYDMAAFMMSMRGELCSQTKFLVPLHFSNKNQMKLSFRKMSRLNPDGYAIPMRFLGSDMESYAWFASILCFLHQEGVEIVHLFATSKKEVRIICAAATALKMFQQLSFDSGGYDQSMYGPPKYIDDRTLGYISLKKCSHPIFSSFLRNKHKLTGEERDELIVHNAFAISDNTQSLVERARNLRSFKKFLMENKHLTKIPQIVIRTIEIMQNWVR